MRTELPKAIQLAMTRWREGIDIFPQGYIRFHQNLAEGALKWLVAEHHLTVHNTGMQKDGWLDGMQVFFAVVETPKGNLLRLQWHDGNQGFMVKNPGGGSSMLFDSDLD